MVSVGCVQPAAVTCEDGRTCPQATACDEIHHLCVQPDAMQACMGVAAGMACTLSSGASGTCRDGVCLTSVCGDGVASEVEQCDGEDLKGASTCQDAAYYDGGALKCTPQCTYDVSACSRRCGDGVLDPEEQCEGDDQLGVIDGAPATCKAIGYYSEPGLKCTALCTYDTSDCKGYCGDGMINGAELCEGAPPEKTCIDLGFDRGATTCTIQCSANTNACASIGWHRVLSPDNVHLGALFGT